MRILTGFVLYKKILSPKSLEYRPSLRGLRIKTEGFIFSYTTKKPVSISFITWQRLISTGILS